MADDLLPSPQEEALARLENELNKERERRREERFLWILYSIITADVFILDGAHNAAIPIVVLVLELIGLTVVSKRLNISSAAVFIDRMSAFLAKESGK